MTGQRANPGVNGHPGAGGPVWPRPGRHGLGGRQAHLTSPPPGESAPDRTTEGPGEPGPDQGPTGGAHEAYDPGGREDREAVAEVHRALVDRITEAEDAEAARALIDEAVDRWARRQAAAGRPVPPVATQRWVAQTVHDEFFGLGRLQPLLDDPTVEDIDINGCDQTWVHHSDGSKRLGPPAAESDEALVRKLRVWGVHQGQTSREFSARAPLLNVALGEGQRLAATMAVTPRPHVSIRCHRLVDVTLDQLVDVGTVDRELRGFLGAATRARLTIAVTGGVAAGKTTLVRALLNELDPDERLVTLETDYELGMHWMPHRHRDVVPMQERQAHAEDRGAITLTDLIPHALRTHPDRIIVGEVRDAEIRPMLQAINSGHPGSLFTVHADSAEEIFSRLLALALQGRLEMSERAVHLQVGTAVDLVVHLQRDRASGARYVSEVIEVHPPNRDSGGWPVPLHAYQPGPDGRAAPATRPRCVQNGLLARYGFDPGVFWR